MFAYYIPRVVLVLKKKVLNNHTREKAQEENLINYRVNTLGKFFGFCVNCAYRL